MKLVAFAKINDASQAAAGDVINVAKVEKLGDDDRQVVRLRFGKLPPFEQLACIVTPAEGRQFGAELSTDDEGVFATVVVEASPIAFQFFLVDLLG